MKTPAPEFTTYHRHRRHPDAHRHTTYARTGNAPSHKHCRSRSHAYCSPRGLDSDRADRRRSRTWKDRHMRCPHNAPVTREKRKKDIGVSKLALPRQRVLHLLLGIADTAGTRLAGPETWTTSEIQRMRPPPSGGASAAPFPDTST